MVRTDQRMTLTVAFSIPITRVCIGAMPTGRQVKEGFFVGILHLTIGVGTGRSTALQIRTIKLF